MKKKVIAVLITALCLAGCGKTDDVTSDSAAPSNASTPVAEVTPAPTAEPTEEPYTGPREDFSGDMLDLFYGGSFSVSFDGEPDGARVQMQLVQTGDIKYFTWISGQTSFSMWHDGETTYLEERDGTKYKWKSDTFDIPLDEYIDFDDLSGIVFLGYRDQSDVYEWNGITVTYSIDEKTTMFSTGASGILITISDIGDNQTEVEKRVVEFATEVSKEDGQEYLDDLLDRLAFVDQGGIENAMDLFWDGEFQMTVVAANGNAYAEYILAYSPELKFCTAFCNNALVKIWYDGEYLYLEDAEGKCKWKSDTFDCPFDDLIDFDNLPELKRVKVEEKTDTYQLGKLSIRYDKDGRSANLYSDELGITSAIESSYGFDFQFSDDYRRDFVEVDKSVGDQRLSKYHVEF